MSFIERIGLSVLHRLDPETAHGLSLRALQMGLAPLPRVPSLPRLRTKIGGITLANPLGLAAGYDKNATALWPLTQAGFGFVEVGAATPHPQSGNPRPRLFRYSAERAVINRFGFNNDGAAAIAPRLKNRARDVPIGLNLGANKDSADRAADFANVLAVCGQYIDFATVNVSSPNTERLRDLQGVEALTAVLNGVLAVRDGLPNNPAVFLKIAPDLGDGEITDIARVAVETGIDAIVATNTTLARDGLSGPQAQQTGGLSGRPLFDISTRVLARLALETGSEIPLIGVGGIDSAETAYAKICAGASALQIYSGLVFGGLSLIPEILVGLDTLLAQDGYDRIAQAVGSKTNKWAA